ncbi:MAG: molecular chaperone [Acidobacteria bacterium 13_1_40CM_2_68_5]|nr:MAG: molecular chaperone [Acidobacteria bacterium 13_1_40CM_2_68_5]
MNLMRWEPFRDFATLSDSMNRVLNDPLFRLAPTETVGSWLPPVDIEEEGDRVVLRAEIPGVSRDDIDVSVENGTLTLRGEKKQERKIEAENADRLERFYGSFSRSFVLPTRINAERIKATYKDGVLEVVLPKAEEARPKKIKVQGTGDPS